MQGVWILINNAFYGIFFFTPPCCLQSLLPSHNESDPHFATSKLYFRISSNLQSGGNSAIAKTRGSERYREGGK